MGNNASPDKFPSIEEQIAMIKRARVESDAMIVFQKILIMVVVLTIIVGIFVAFFDLDYQGCRIRAEGIGKKFQWAPLAGCRIIVNDRLIPLTNLQYEITEPQ